MKKVQLGGMFLLSLLMDSSLFSSLYVAAAIKGCIRIGSGRCLDDSFGSAGDTRSMIMQDETILQALKSEHAELSSESESLESWLETSYQMLKLSFYTRKLSFGNYKKSATATTGYITEPLWLCEYCHFDTAKQL